MTDFLINIELHENSSFQQQIREKLVQLIKQDTFGNKALPSGRKMAQLIGVSRNTIVLVYESLVDEGYLIARKRSGFFVDPNFVFESGPDLVHSEPIETSRKPNWCKRLSSRPSQLSSLNKDRNWIKNPYFNFRLMVDRLYMQHCASLHTLCKLSPVG